MGDGINLNLHYFTFILLCNGVIPLKRIMLHNVNNDFFHFRIFDS